MKKKQLNDLIDTAADGIKSEADIVDAMKLIRKSFYEKALNGELDVHLGYERYAESPSGNARNGVTTKTVYTDDGPVDIDTPRDRKGEFEPHIIKKRQTRAPLIDERILSLYAKGMSTREIVDVLEEHCGTEVSPALVSKATDSVLL